MTSNISGHQFLEGEDIVIVQSGTDTDVLKTDIKHVKIKSIREDVRNYVEQTASKELKVFTSSTPVDGGQIDVLDNETLYYHPAAATAALEDVAIEITSDGDYFVDVTNQKLFNEKASDQIGDIELSLESTNKYVEALKASTVFFPDDTDPTKVNYFNTTNQYPPSEETGAVVNINDLTHLNSQLETADRNLQSQIDLAESRVEALFNVKFDSGYFCYQSEDPENDLPTIGQIKTDLTNETADIVASVHSRSYDATYGGQDEDPDNATTINNYLVASVGDTIVTGFDTFKLTEVTVVDETAALGDRVYILKGTSTLSTTDLVEDGSFNTLRIVGDGEFDPADLIGKYVRTGGDNMSGPLTIGTSENVALAVGGDDGNYNLEIKPTGAVFSGRETFEDSELVTKRYVDNVEFQGDYLPLSGGTMTGEILGAASGYVLKCASVDTYITYDGRIQLKATGTNNTYLFSVFASGLKTDMSECAFRVTGDGKVKAGHSASAPFMAIDDNDVTTKSYVDKQKTIIPVVSDTPGDIEKGSMWFSTKDNCLYIKTNP